MVEWEEGEWGPEMMDKVGEERGKRKWDGDWGMGHSRIGVGWGQEFQQKEKGRIL